MATRAINNKSATKGIRFPHEMIELIESCIEREKNSNQSANFSAWVLDACEQKIKAIKCSNRTNK
ncbi:YlcI/YnfO family protein [Klebsiella sp. WP8-S18-ESBL-06]|uniref:YlcI/YnfO family protein n=1 Tax=Klebsiella sp. WP8-S18-ESBL-06 TaxID=2675726 RepID=UPI0015FF9FB1|nr:YlcI/YnfO family protein [Klebsiella sp. WP8-S18-ESBL-06]